MQAEPLLLMDTDIVSLMGRQKAPPGLRPWLLQIGIHRLALCYPVITELMRGAHLKVRDDPESALRIANWANDVVRMGFPFPEMTAAVAAKYAEMTSVPGLRHLWTVQRNQKSNRLGHDLAISAVAIVHRMPILTANVDDFLRIHELFPLPGLHHPMKAQWYIGAGFDVPLPYFDPTEPDPHEKALPQLSKAPSTVSFEPANGPQ
ncbi:type II toxin-antitoxin system VapC family toxin [Rhizobium laguerreae]|uniref:type II toxin-antitoxin system VapC family toxin n=1 Tax=Rhizobium laguerreae TaxID=1076926 RepID=UPI00300BC90F